MMMLATVGIVVLFSIVTFFMWRVICYGRRCAHRGHEHMIVHKRAVNSALVATVPLIVLIVVFERFLSEASPPIWLLGVHLSFVVLFYPPFLLLRFKVTGEKMPKYHRPLAYLCAAAFVGTLTTGIAMLVLLNLAMV